MTGNHEQLIFIHIYCTEMPGLLIAVKLISAPFWRMVEIVQFYLEAGMKGQDKTMEKGEGYDPNNLLSALIAKLKLKNDAALSRALEVAPPVISKIRHRRLPVGASLLIRMQEVSDLSIRDLRSLMGDRRNKFRISDKQFKPKQASVN